MCGDDFQRLFRDLSAAHRAVRSGSKRELFHDKRRRFTHAKRVILGNVPFQLCKTVGGIRLKRMLKARILIRKHERLRERAAEFCSRANLRLQNAESPAILSP